MQHLFAKIYLHHISLYSNNKQNEILFETEKPHPLSQIEGVEFGKIPAFESILEGRFGGSYEIFWEGLYNRKDRLNIYCDAKIYTQLFLQFFKNILPDASSKDIYQLYLYNLMNTRLRGLLNRQRLAQPYKKFSADLPYLTEQEFDVLYAETVEINFLKACSKHDVSFEILLANYFIDRDSVESSYFLTKLKKFSWKTWLNDIEILKLEILNAIYQLPKLLNIEVDVDTIVTNPDRFERTILSHKLLAWMTDERFNVENIDYIASRYPKEGFKLLAEKLHPIFGVINATPADSKAFELGDYILQTDIVYSGRYEEYLAKDIYRGVGCVFTNDLLFYKSNHLLVGFIYDCVRNKRNSDLSFLKL